jgi:hypothetical protein
MTGAICQNDDFRKEGDFNRRIHGRRRRKEFLCLSAVLPLSVCSARFVLNKVLAFVLFLARAKVGSHSDQFRLLPTGKAKTLRLPRLRGFALKITANRAQSNPVKVI